MTYTKDSKIWREIRAHSGYWFTPETLSWFNSRICWQTLTEYQDGFLFITSETNYNNERRFTIRQITKAPGLVLDYDIETVGDFLKYEKLEHAKQALNNLKGFSDFLNSVADNLNA